MKIKNKKTGEIKECVVIPIDSNGYPNEYQVFEKGGSLAELNAEWEDAPEEAIQVHIEGIQNVYMGGGRVYIDYASAQEAEKAVEKLKAFKRLKDKGFSFDPVDRYEALCGNGFNIPITATMPPEAYTDAGVSKDLDVCFGGEE